jgi:Flp pilus assembly CpaF family ATPase
MAANLDPVTVIIRGKHDTGKTTLANLLKMFLEENGYRHVVVKDIEPLSQEQKAPFWDRFTRNRDLREVNIHIELEE